MFRIVPALIFAIIITGCISCSSQKKTAYFPNQGTTEMSSSNQGPKPVIEINDMLSITVSSLSAQSNNAFDPPHQSTVTAIGYNTTINPLSGYLVGPEGYVKLPQIGSVMAAGLTPHELEDTITNRLLAKQLYVDPIVDVRHLNFKVTVLGEVAHPSVFNIPNSKVSLLEAIGMAGDLTIYGKRDNVLLIREENKKKITVRLNLNSEDLFKSPYYYLKTNDVIYVEPNS